MCAESEKKAERSRPINANCETEQSMQQSDFNCCRLNYSCSCLLLLSPLESSPHCFTCCNCFLRNSNSTPQGNFASSRVPPLGLQSQLCCRFLHNEGYQSEGDSKSCFYHAPTEVPLDLHHRICCICCPSHHIKPSLLNPKFGQSTLTCLPSIPVCYSTNCTSSDLCVNDPTSMQIKSHCDSTSPSIKTTNTFSTVPGKFQIQSKNSKLLRGIESVFRINRAKLPSLFSVKVWLHLLLLLSCLITTDALEARKRARNLDSSSVYSGNRSKRSSEEASILDFAPPGAPGSVDSGKMCMLNRCNEWLHMASLFDRVVIEQCVIFNNDIECLRKIESACYLNLYYKGHRSWAEQKFNELNCDKVFQDAERGQISEFNKRLGQERNNSVPIENLCYIEQPNISLQSSPVFCSLFGDPHIVTYGRRKQTCATLGAWPLVDNLYFTIQALNVPIGQGSDQSNNRDQEKTAHSRETSTQVSNSDLQPSSTGRYLNRGQRDTNSALSSPSAITRVMVVFRSKMNCVAKEKIYDTTEGSLPPSFNDGTFSGGHSDNLYVMQKTNGTHIELHAKFINTTIVIRRVGAYLSISVVSPVDVAKALPSYGHSSNDFHMELCSAGCPDSETLAEFPATPPRVAGRVSQVTYDSARQLCRHLSGFFFDSCVFDVMTTGDWKTFVEIGQRSSEDEGRLNIRSADESYLNLFPSPGSSSNRKGTSICSPIKSSALVWLLMFLSFLFKLKCSI